MRNLKKVLSLALAMVMLLGMMVVGAGATSFTDDADITHQEAVTVVSGMEILTGVGDNTFNPKGTLSRAEAAVVIAKLDLGAAFGNLATTNASTFKDVGAGYGWAKPYIDYCAARGLIAGDGNGYFMPADKVTGVQFALMVARVLGYEDANENIGGADWEVNAAALARKAGLTVDVELGSDAIPRDDMAQVAFNALTADMVEYKQSAITIGNVTIPAGKASSVDGTKTTAPSSKDYRGVGTDDTTRQLCEEKFPTLKLNSNSTDNMGHPAQKWSYKGEEVGTYAKTPSYTGYITAKNNTLAKFVDNISKRLDETAPTATYLNGIEGASWTPAPGDYVELYVDSNDSSKIDKIVVTHKTVAELSGDATTRVVDGETQVRVPGVTGLTAYNSNITTSNVHGYDGLVAGDIVLWYRGGNADHDAPGSSWYIEKANSFEGTLTAASSSNVYTIDGNKYDRSGVSRFLDSNTIIVTDFNKQSATWFTDNDNNIVWVKGVENTDVAYLIAVKSQNDTWTGIATGSSVKTAMLLLPDNTVVTAEYKNSTGFTATAGTFVKYTVKDDVYTLSDAGTAAANRAGNHADGAAGQTISVTKGNPTVTFGSSNTVLTNADTIFFIRDYKGGTGTEHEYKNSFAMYTGYANVPTTGNLTIAVENTSSPTKVPEVSAAAYLGANGYAKYVVIYAGTQIANTSSASEIFYVVDGKVTTLYDADGVSGYSVRAIKNGDDEITNLVFKDNPGFTTSSAGNAYVILSYDGDMVKTFGKNASNTGAANPITDGTPDDCVVGAAAGYEKVTATTVKLGGTAYGMKDDAKVYYVDPAKDEGDELTVMSVKDLDKDVNDDIIAIRGSKLPADASYHSIVTLFITAKADGRGQLPQGAGKTAIEDMLTQEGAATVTNADVSGGIDVENGQTLNLNGTTSAAGTVTAKSGSTINVGADLDANTTIATEAGSTVVLGGNTNTLPNITGKGTIEVSTTIDTEGSGNVGDLAGVITKLGVATNVGTADGTTNFTPGVQIKGSAELIDYSSVFTVNEIVAKWNGAGETASSTVSMQVFKIPSTNVAAGATVKAYYTTKSTVPAADVAGANWTAITFGYGSGAGSTVAAGDLEAGDSSLEILVPVGDKVTAVMYVVDKDGAGASESPVTFIFKAN